MGTKRPAARKPNPKRSQAAARALKKQPRRARSKRALSRKARGPAKRRSASAAR